MVPRSIQIRAQGAGVPGSGNVMFRSPDKTASRMRRPVGKLKLAAIPPRRHATGTHVRSRHCSAANRNTLRHHRRLASQLYRQSHALVRGAVPSSALFYGRWMIGFCPANLDRRSMPERSVLPSMSRSSRIRKSQKYTAQFHRALPFRTQPSGQRKAPPIPCRESKDGPKDRELSPAAWRLAQLSFPCSLIFDQTGLEASSKKHAACRSFSRGGF